MKQETKKRGIWEVMYDKLNLETEQNKELVKSIVNRLQTKNQELAKALQDMIDVNSTILAVMALERVERFDLVERLKKNILNSQQILQEASLTDK